MTSQLDLMPDLIQNTDKPFIDDTSEDRVASIASWLIDRGYPVGTNDKYSLMNEYLRKVNGELPT